MSLWADFLTNEQRVIYKWKHYFPAYERHFGHYVNRPVTFIEIGCGLGGSLQMWKRFFGPYARIIGIDVDPKCAFFAEDQIEIRIGPQQDHEFLQSILKEFGEPDIVLDDGSHIMRHVVSTFQFLYPRTARDGIYAVEDLQTAYWDNYEGGLRRPGTFIELCKPLIDELNAEYTKGALLPTEFSRSTLSVHFYNAMAIFERGAHTKLIPLKTGQGVSGQASSNPSSGPVFFVSPNRSK